MEGCPTYVAGIDWASTQHDVCILEMAGRIRTRFCVPHTAAGLAELCRQLAGFSPPPNLPVALERPSGLLVDTLLEAGFPVIPIHPNALKASRPRYSAAQAKSDPGDAFILADLLRTDGHRFRPLRPLGDATRALRALVRTRDDLVAQRVRLANQLRALLESFWPGAAVIFRDIDSPIALEFLARYPTPQSAAHLGHRRLAAFLTRHAYCGRRDPVELLRRLRQAASGRTGEEESHAKGELVRAFVAVLQPLVGQLQQLAAAVQHAVLQHPDGAVLMSFPCAGRINAAQILAELGDDRLRFVSAEQLAAEAGLAPVTYTSGKHRGVSCRWACNKRLRRALTCFAGNSRRASPWAANLYGRARARGCNHPHAVRILGRAWSRVLWRCWQSATPYEARSHAAARSFLVAA